MALFAGCEGREGNPARDGATAEEKESKSKSLDNHGAEMLPAENRRLVDVTRDKPVKVSVRVVVPTRDHPKVSCDTRLSNFTQAYVYIFREIRMRILIVVLTLFRTKLIRYA